MLKRFGNRYIQLCRRFLKIDIQMKSETFLLGLMINNSKSQMELCVYTQQLQQDCYMLRTGKLHNGGMDSKDD